MKKEFTVLDMKQAAKIKGQILSYCHLMVRPEVSWDTLWCTLLN